MGEDIRFDEHLASVRMQVIRHYRLSQPFLELDPVRQVAERLVPGFPGLAVGLHVAGNRFPVGFINRGACEDVVELIEGYVSPKVFVQVMGIFVAVNEPAQGIEEFSFIKGLLAVAVAFLVLGDCGIAAFEHILHFAPVDRTSVHLLRKALEEIFGSSEFHCGSILFQCVDPVDIVNVGAGRSASVVSDSHGVQDPMTVGCILLEAVEQFFLGHVPVVGTSGVAEDP